MVKAYMRHSSEIPYYPTIEKYPEEPGKFSKDLNTPWMMLELFNYPRLTYNPEYQLVYWLTRYIAVLGDSRYVEWPPGLLKWLNDADIPITERQREVGKVLMVRMMHSIGENHTATIWNERQTALKHAEELRRRKKLDTVTDALNSYEGRWIHWWLLRLATLEPRIMITGRPFWSKSLIELAHLLQQERPERLPKPPRRDVVIRRRALVGPFNWLAIKDHSPRCIRPDINAFREKLAEDVAYYQDKPSRDDVLALKGKNILWIDDGPGVDNYDGNPARDSLHDSIEESPTKTNRYSWENAVKQASGMRRRGKTDLEIADKLKVAPERVFDFFFESDNRPLWHNPKTGRLEYFKGEVYSREIEDNDPEEERTWRIGTPGKCLYCGARSEQFICWRCGWEEDRHNAELVNAKLLGDPRKENADTLRNLAWRGSYPLHTANFTRPLVFNRGDTVPEIRRHVEYLHNKYPQNPKSRIKEVSDADVRSCWHRYFIPKPTQVWMEPSLKRGSWWGKTDTIRDIIDSPEGVLYRIGKALEPLGEKKMKMPLRIAWEILNMYGNPFTKNIPENQPGHFGWLPVGRLLLNYTRVNLGKKIGVSPATITTAFRLLEEAMPNMHLPATPLRVAAGMIDNAVNIESVNDNPPAGTSPELHSS